MSQESTMICVDNSEWMRNGDLPPTRFNCQQEAVRALIHYKLRSNPENAVGLLSMAGRIEVLNSLLTDDRKLMVRLHSLGINGVAQVLSGIKTAHLALKNRKNRLHRQRIIMFIGSPLDPLIGEQEAFMKFAKKLRKEKVNVDFILFGEATSENNQIIIDFLSTINGPDGTDSHLLVVPSGDTKLFDALLRSPICEGAIAPGGGMAGGGDFGIDEDDPELAMALRISLEEQRMRQQQGGDAGGAEARDNAAHHMEVDQQGGGGGPAPPPIRAPTPPASTAGHHEQQFPANFEAMTEEEQMAYALRLSMQEGHDEQSTHPHDGQPQQGSRSPSMATATPAPTPMETEDVVVGPGGDTVGDLLNDPARLQQLVDQQQGRQQTRTAQTGEDSAQSSSSSHKGADSTKTSKSNETSKKGDK